eukprot:CAMPEP_0113501072 /NCGR_PEP_ID=MMETSP0014_2-20120614/32731_1 /TAXON_ID=2857 /ORGANISM="Nitzschia sp." /LENGTH=49 /DNA_ID=CAMNT_0000395579 /DNA_START=174 /DNA_END=323 /DNA_ORIENTATION=+ /assembly_acc=CAM_ASM_000159
MRSQIQLVSFDIGAAGLNADVASVDDQAVGFDVEAASRAVEFLRHQKIR